jgi:hypothetical protein
MSVLTIAQGVADDVGLNRPTALIGSTDATSIRFLRAINLVGKKLATMKWDELIKEATITTANGTFQYALPTDYDSMVNDTAWNQTQDTQIFMISPQRWSYEKSAVTSNYHDQIRLAGDSLTSIGKQITIHPTPEGVETIRYEYYSKNWITDDTGVTEDTAVNADDDIPVFDEELVTLGVTWRILKAIGQPYEEEKTEFDDQTEVYLAKSGGSKPLHTDANIPTISNIPETGFGT